MKAGIWMVVVLMGALAVEVAAAENNSSPAPLIMQKDIESLCTSEEIVYFSCKLPKNKFVSLCGSDFRNASGSELNPDTVVKYRFGRPDRIELEFPSDKEKASKIFEGNSRSTPTLQVSTLRFNNNGITYTVGGYFSFRSNPPSAFYGVEVRFKDNKEMKIECNSEPILSPDFEVLTGLLAPIPKRH